MRLQIGPTLFSFAVLSVAAIVGCDTPVRSQNAPTPVVPAERLDAPAKDHADVKVDVGHGRGINVDVDRTPTRGRTAADVDVNIGGPKGGIRVDIDENANF
jgi:hypothetical protein